jgi:hypothetical protein
MYCIRVIYLPKALTNFQFNIHLKLRSYDQQTSSFLKCNPGESHPWIMDFNCLIRFFCALFSSEYTLLLFVNEWTVNSQFKWKFLLSQYFLMVLFVVFNATFNNISVISWRSVLLVEETAIPRERKPPNCCCVSHCQILSHNVVHPPWAGFESTSLEW